jgi:hypothetical protein
MLHACVERFDVMGGRGNILDWDEKWTMPREPRIPGTAHSSQQDMSVPPSSPPRPWRPLTARRGSSAPAAPTAPASPAPPWPTALLARRRLLFFSKKPDGYTVSVGPTSQPKKLNRWWREWQLGKCEFIFDGSEGNFEILMATKEVL